MTIPNAQYVSARRRRIKDMLVAEAGGKCKDCDAEHPPFMFDFDHRDPAEKEFSIGGNGMTRSINRCREEVKKCDLVCSNCHRMRTHKQRCKGCQHCA